MFNHVQLAGNSTMWNKLMNSIEEQTEDGVIQCGCCKGMGWGSGYGQVTPNPNPNQLAKRRPPRRRLAHTRRAGVVPPRRRPPPPVRRPAVRLVRVRVSV